MSVVVSKPTPLKSFLYRSSDDIPARWVQGGFFLLKVDRITSNGETVKVWMPIFFHDLSDPSGNRGYHPRDGLIILDTPSLALKDLVIPSFRSGYVGYKGPAIVRVTQQGTHNTIKGLPFGQLSWSVKKTFSPFDPSLLTNENASRSREVNIDSNDVIQLVCHQLYMRYNKSTTFPEPFLRVGSTSKYKPNPANRILSPDLAVIDGVLVWKDNAIGSINSGVVQFSSPDFEILRKEVEQCLRKLNNN